MGVRKPQSGWEQTFLECREDLLSFFRRKTRSDQLSHDLLQDLFVRMSRNTRLAGIEDHKAYLFTAARSVFIDSTRARKRRPEEANILDEGDATFADASADQLQIAIDRQRLRIMDEALAKLPEETRAMIHMTRIDGMPVKTVAELFGVSKSAVEKRIAKGLGACRAALGEDG